MHFHPDCFVNTFDSTLWSILIKDTTMGLWEGRRAATSHYAQYLFGASRTVLCYSRNLARSPLCLGHNPFKKNRTFKKYLFDEGFELQPFAFLISFVCASDLVSFPFFFYFFSFFLCAFSYFLFFFFKCMIF